MDWAEQRVDLIAPVGIVAFAAHMNVARDVGAEDQQDGAFGNEFLVAAKDAHLVAQPLVINDDNAVALQIARCRCPLRGIQDLFQGRFGKRDVLVGPRAAVRQQGFQDRVVVPRRKAPEGGPFGCRLVHGSDSFLFVCTLSRPVIGRSLRRLRRRRV